MFRLFPLPDDMNFAGIVPRIGHYLKSLYMKRFRANRMRRRIERRKRKALKALDKQLF